MAFTTPATAVASTILTAAWLNTYVRDNTAWIATDSPAVRAYNNANVSIANNSLQAVTLNSERFDNSGSHSTSVNTPRITAPAGAGGKYLIGAHLAYAGNGTGVRANNVRLNGGSFVSTTTLLPPGAVEAQFTTATVYALSAADYVEMVAFQTSGGALNVVGTDLYSPEFYAFWFRT